MDFQLLRSGARTTRHEMKPTLCPRDGRVLACRKIKPRTQHVRNYKVEKLTKHIMDETKQNVEHFVGVRAQRDTK